MAKPKNPCRADCDGRSATCHASCKKYAEYEKLRNLYYAEKEIQLKGFPSDKGVMKMMKKNYRSPHKWGNYE